MNGSDFGGCAVTIPLKLEIMKYMTELTDAAEAIGAVNTVIPLGSGKFVGDNTDWLGIANSLYKNGVPNLKNLKSVAGIVIGGGGTSRAAAYALHQMGCTKIYMVNRTAAKLYDIKDNLPSSYNIEILESEGDVDKVSAVSIAVSTIPADKPIDSSLLSKIDRIFATSTAATNSFSPTLLDAAYKPRITPIMALASEKYCWTVVPGVEMLVNQGVEQFIKWTGFQAPYTKVFNAVTSD